MATTPQFVGTARTSAIKLRASDGTNAKTLLVAGSNGSLLEGLFVTSNDPTSRFLSVLLVNPSQAESFLVDSISIPSASPAVPVVMVSLLNPSRWVWLDPNNVKWVIGHGWEIRCAMTTAVSSSAEVAVIANFGDF